MLSSRRATITGCFASHLRVISIHALLAESDPCSTIFLAVYGISIHALLAESDIDAEIAERERQSFLSTLSLRRATPDPASGRPARYISIHALLAESDEKPPSLRRQAPDFYPRSPCGERPTARHPVERRRYISIHALLAESDLYIFQLLFLFL